MTTPAIAVPQARAVPRARLRRGGSMPLGRQIIFQLVCIGIAVTVLFPIVWIVGMSLDPRNIARPDSIIPPGASFDAYARVLARPTLNPVSFIQLAFNSVLLAVSVSLVSVGFGVLGAYAFSRMRFRGRSFLMLAVLTVLMLPAVATIGPLYISLTRVNVGGIVLGQSLVGVALAVASSQLPFA